MTNDERQRLQREIFGEDGKTFNKQALDRYANALRAEQRDKDFNKAIELWLAGWTSEPIRDGLEIMSWYWRRPPIGKRKFGRLFLSTDQALKHLRASQ